MVLLFIPELRVYVSRFFSWIWSGAVWCWNALISSYSLPGWFLIILFMLALFSIGMIIYAWKEKHQPEYKSYTEDFLYGVKWRWTWNGSSINNIWCYCPVCDATLVYDDNSYNRLYYGATPKTDFICENCSRQIKASIEGGNKRYALGLIEREVHRRIRTGQYKI